MYDVFISYKRKDNEFFAGRVCDWLSNRGYKVYLDVENQSSGEFAKMLEAKIDECPNFILIAEPDTLAQLGVRGDWVGRETAHAIKQQKNILLLYSDKLAFPEKLPSKLEKVPSITAFRVPMDTFHASMSVVAHELKSPERPEPDAWKGKVQASRDVFMTGRELMDTKYTSLEDTLFLCDAGAEGCMVKSIRMACYANSLLLTSAPSLIDSTAYAINKGRMFTAFQKVLSYGKTVELIITAPGSEATKEAIRSEKLGNSALEKIDCLEAIFYSSYASIKTLIKDDEVFKNAEAENRLNYYVTDVALPYALFFVEYLPGFESLNHVRIDLYSPGVKSSARRRTMYVFQDTSPDNYRFFEESYNFLKKPRASLKKLSSMDEKWMARWEEIKKKIARDVN